MTVGGVRPRVLAGAVLGIIVLAAVAGLVWFAGARTSRAGGGDSFSAETTPTLAGTFPSGRSQALRNPIGIAVSGRRVYVAESEAGAVRVFDTDGSDVASIAVPLATGAAAAYPVDVAVLGGGRLAVLDTSGSRIVVLDAERGRVATVVASAGSSGALLMPTALASANGELYVADAGDHTVKVYGDDWRLKRVLGAALRPSLTFVGGMAIVADRLWVSDSNAGRVVALDSASGAQKALLPAAFSLPRGLAAGPAGSVLVADAFAHAVRSFDASLTPRFTLPDASGAAHATLSSPRGVAYAEESGVAYVTDARSGVVRVFRFENER